MNGQAPPRRRHPLPLPLLVLLLILAASLVPRLPILWNAEVAFNSDEAANALVVKHMLEGKDFTFHNWGAHYYGVVEGLMAIPLTWVFGLTPLAFKLAAVAGFLLLVAATYLLGRRLYGPAEGLAAAALLTVFSPQLVLWSTLASGGYTLVVGWGSLTFAHLAGTRRQPNATKVAILGFLVGFGLYIYELYLVYVAILAGLALTSSFVWKAALAPSPPERSAALRLAPAQLRGAALFLAGFLVGWAPKLWTTLFGGTATKLPAYGLASPEVMRANLELLVTQCVPALLGVNPAGNEDLEQWVGPTLALTAGVGVLVLLAWAAAWLQAVPRTGRDLRGALRRPPGEIGMESLLVLLVPVAALLFVLSPNPTGVLSSRYLLPWLTSLPVLAGGWLVRLWRHDRITRLTRLATVALAVLLVGYPGVQTLLLHVSSGYLTADLRLPRSRDSLHTVFRELRRQGIRGGYGWYWIAYEANFLSGEQIVIAPSDGWDRYPAYTRFVDALPRPAYLFEVTQETERVREAQFLERVRATGRPFERRRIGQYAIYTSPEGGRLLPPSLARGPNRLQQPRAEVAARGVPPVASPGQILTVPARLTNLGADVWPAYGLDGTGHYRVTLSYRWLDANGNEVTGHAAERTPLPGDVLPGVSVDLVARVQVPAAAGSYRLVLTPIQEDVLWFADVPDGGAAVFPVTVQAMVRAGGDR